MFQLVDKLKKSDPDPEPCKDEAEREAVAKFLEEINNHPYMTFLRGLPKADICMMKMEGFGRGIVAQSEIAAGTIVDYTDGNIVLNPNPKLAKNYLKANMCIKVKKGHDRMIDAVYTMGRIYYMNHSCDPNLTLTSTFLNHGSMGRMQIVQFITNKDVKRGDQLTFHYYEGVPSASKHLVIRTSEFEGSVKCLCSPDCKNYIHAAESVHKRDVH